MAIPRAVASTLLCRNVVVQRIAASRPVGIDDSRKVSACMGLSLVKRYSMLGSFQHQPSRGGSPPWCAGTSRYDLACLSACHIQPLNLVARHEQRDTSGSI